jgi:cupin 2 domain-containing protein
MRRGNLFSGLPASLPEELFDVLLEGDTFRLERIASAGHATAAGAWYDQERDEWVLVLRGAARLRFEREPAPVELGPGDYVLIPAHARHRVEWTDPTQPTIWLALHYRRS